jgi:hypothetical protein
LTENKIKCLKKSKKDADIVVGAVVLLAVNPGETTMVALHPEPNSLHLIKLIKYISD